MDYLLIEFEDGQLLYQEIQDGSVIGYRDEQGTLIFEQPPVGVGAEVVDADPPKLDWMTHA